MILHALEKLLARLRKRYGPEVIIRACYEAGPCGFGIARRLKQLGAECAVVAPSLTPTRAGNRLKTDKRDARKLARLLRAGELTEIYIPEPTDEAMRDLCRARSDAVDDRRRSRHRLKAFLLRHGYRYQGKSAWIAAHERYLRELMLAHPAMKVILEEYLISVQLGSERIARCEAAMRDLLGKWRLEPGGARAHGHERLPNGGGHDRGERTGSAGSLHASAAGDGVSGPGAERKVFQ